MIRRLPFPAVALLAAFTVGLPAVAHAVHHEPLLIVCGSHCAELAQAVQDAGGSVTFHYENLDAFVAKIPSARRAEIMGRPGVEKALKDMHMAPPLPVRPGQPSRGSGLVRVETAGAVALDAAAVAQLAAVLPADAQLTHSLLGAAALHAQGRLGAGVTVAVIDSGVANAPAVASLRGSVIGGESFVDDDPVASATSTRNDPHGTRVASAIAGHALFVAPRTSRLVAALTAHAPETLIPCEAPPAKVPCPAGSFAVPLTGVAPAARIYAMKVFDSRGEESFLSNVLAAMDRAITLRRNFNRGMPSVPVAGDGSEDHPFVYDSLKIDVVNMSFGGPTLFAGRDLADRFTRKMLEVGITVVAAAGNDGFAALTVTSPGTGLGSLTVGAASTPAHERIAAELEFGAGMGGLFRPFEGIQTASFSSRGPTADGRLEPELIAPGVAVLAQAPNGDLNVVSGTSIAAPLVAGAAALLREAAPAASAAQVRNALAATANPRLLADGSGRLDRGRGLVDVGRALERLQRSWVSELILPGLGSPSVALNVAFTGLVPVAFHDDRFVTRVRDLQPGQAAQFVVLSDDQTDQLTVRVKRITPELPIERQNALLGDGVLLHVADAPTSMDGSRVFAHLAADETFTIDNPQSGLVRVALLGDTTNAGRISAELVIERRRTPQGRPTAQGRVRQGDLIPVQVEVPAGASELVWELFQREDWGAYASNDLDLILVTPAGEVVDHPGATLASPERVTVAQPAAGTWTALVQGFTVNTAEPGRFTLRATADGRRLSQR